jgi:hypothetical protein
LFSPVSLDYGPGACAPGDAKGRRCDRRDQLYEIGTVAIPDAILHKSGALTCDEQAFLRRRTQISERIIGAAPALTDVARIVHSIDERFDGTGVPDGLHGDQIPLGSRILAVCAAYVTSTQAPHAGAPQTTYGGAPPHHHRRCPHRTAPTGRHAV